LGGGDGLTVSKLVETSDILQNSLDKETANKVSPACLAKA
jgi:hypothetical protein